MNSRSLAYTIVSLFDRGVSAQHISETLLREVGSTQDTLFLQNLIRDLEFITKKRAEFDQVHMIASDKEMFEESLPSFARGEKMIIHPASSSEKGFHIRGKGHQYDATFSTNLIRFRNHLIK